MSYEDFPTLDDLTDPFTGEAEETLTHVHTPRRIDAQEQNEQTLEMREIRRNERRALRALRRAEREASRYGMFPTPA